MYQPPTMICNEDVLTRAEKELEAERNQEFIDDLERAESEADDVIRELDALASESGDLAYASLLVRMAKDVVKARRQIAETWR